MCGLAGFLTVAKDRPDSVHGLVQRMIAPIAHRGPDDVGVWVDAEAGIALGFRRLAILDLSEQGHQPMRSPSGRYTIVFNGEIFNHHDLRGELESIGCPFRGHSDTEVILAGFEQWGLVRTVQRLVGMFAIAVWDAERRTLSLIRDRLGIKPMFVYAQHGLVSFGSELKALINGPAFDRSIDTDALTMYLRYLYVPAPRTIYTHASKLRPGHILTLPSALEDLPASVPFWSVEEASRAGLADQLAASDEEVVAELDRRLREVVRLRMEADVPLGALLSGGVDSSIVVTLMQAQSSRPVKTFSIGFDAPEHDEARYAKQVARHLGTDHTELYVGGDDALAVVPKIPQMFDEPLADPSQIPTYLVSRLAREQVTVALTGDGGDELFAGYNRYSRGEQIIERAGRLPYPIRRLVAQGLGSFSPETWGWMHRVLQPVLPLSAQIRLPGEKVRKLGELMVAESPAMMYRTLVSAWQQPASLVIGGREVCGDFERILDSNNPERLLDRMMLVDQLTYLADDLLAKVDRASMAVSLEARVPLLDHRLVEFSWRIPQRLKIRNGVGKWVLRQVLYRYLPASILDRPKVGFTVPLAQWLRGPLRAWAEELLSPERLVREGILNPTSIRRAWARLLSGRDGNALGLWAVVSFQAWREHWIDGGRQ